MKILSYQGGAMRLLLLGLLLVLTACHSGWNSDPLDGEDDRIKNALAPNTDIKKVAPPDQGALAVDMDFVFNVVEGELLEIPVSYEIFHPEVTLSSIKVQDLEEKFPDAVFIEEGKKSMIRIRPSLDFVPVDAPYKVEYLTVSFFNEYEGQLQEVKRKIAVFVIPENTTAPVVDSLQLVPASSLVQPGVKKTLKIYVKDSSNEYSPRISVVNSFSGGAQVAQFIRIPNEGVYNAVLGSWVFDATIELPREYYIGDSYGRIDVFAYSITGIPSRAKELRLTLNGEKPSFPRIVSEESIVFYANQENKYTFNAYDSRGAGTVVAGCSNAPTDMTCDCRRDGFPNNGVHYCTLSWAPKMVQTHEMIFKAVNQVGVDVATTSKNIKIDVRSAQ